MLVAGGDGDFEGVEALGRGGPGLVIDLHEQYPSLSYGGDEAADVGSGTIGIGVSPVGRLQPDRPAARQCRGCCALWWWATRCSNYGCAGEQTG